ncbi:hypothetical protein [Sinorhizobium americanum]|uniref:hypothetical protein n=1 Tax=Sinorhizobium americanum TaxID=194963 RepID=UPI00104F4D33|nr:hypothetical protein [Sinorhizobium americanum]
MVGNLNPAIFSPDWFRRNIELSIDDGSDAEVQIIHPEIADFMLCDLRFTVERNRITVRSLVHDIELLVALALQMFGGVLGHTPIWAFGVNFERHIDFLSFEKRNALGRMLCPLEPWGAWAKDFPHADPRLNGGMSSITMKKVISSDPEILELFTIQPSNQKEFADTGVFFQINNHFSLGENHKGDADARSHMLDYMRTNVPHYLKTFEGIIDHFMAWGKINE